MSRTAYKDFPAHAPVAPEAVDAFRGALPKLLVFAGDKFLLDARTAGGIPQHNEIAVGFIKNFGELLLGVYEFSLYDALPEEFTRLAAELSTRGVPPEHIRALLKSWVLGIQCLVKSPHAGKLIPPLEWLLRNAERMCLRPESPGALPDERARRFFDLLMAKNRKFAAEHVLSCLRDGLSIENIYTGVLLPALRHIRLLWLQNRISAADEHTAGDICRYVVFRVVDSIFGERQYPFRVLVACMQGEENVLGAEVLAHFLEIKGWVVSFSGHDASDEDILSAAVTSKPQVLLLSVSSIARLPAAKALIESVQQKLTETKIVLEGRAAVLAQSALAPPADGIISGFEEGHKSMLAMVTAHA